MTERVSGYFLLPVLGVIRRRSGAVHASGFDGVPVGTLGVAAVVVTFKTFEAVFFAHPVTRRAVRIVPATVAEQFAQRVRRRRVINVYPAPVLQQVLIAPLPNPDKPKKIKINSNNLI